MVTSPPANRRFQFSIASLLVAMVIVGLALTLWRFDRYVFWMSAMGIVASNVLGVIVALFVTHVCKLPNDGSLRGDDKRNEIEDELVDTWKATRETQDANAGIRRGLADVEAGRFRGLDEFMDEFRSAQNDSPKQSSCR